MQSQAEPHTWTELPADHALIALGSNLGDREATLEAALAELTARSDATIIARSTWHVTAPVGGPAGQEDFKNGVALVRTRLTPEALLSCLQTIELLHGRTRDIEWGPRTLDLDLLMLGGQKRETAELMLPHPRMAERAFVLEPLRELLPQLHLATDESVAKACERLRDQSR